MVNEKLPKFWFLHPKLEPPQTGKTARTVARGHRVRTLLIITQFYPPDFAATGQLISELAAQLSDLKIKVSIFTGQPGYAFTKESAPQREATERVSIQRSRTSRILPLRIRGRAINGLLFCLRAAMHLLKTAKKRDILMVTTEPPYLPIMGYLANLVFGLPYVCLIYDLYPDVAVELNVVPAKHWLVRLWDRCNRQIWQRARAIVVLSSTMKQRIVAKCPEIADKITIVPSWADPKLISPLDKQRNWFAQKFNLTNKFTVLYSGNLGRCHDLDTILLAAQHLRDEPIQFVFIGRGAKLQSCLDQVQCLELTNCQFMPFQDKAVLPYSLTACDLSLVSIGLGLEGIIAPSKLYGILAAGRPVAAICASDSYLRQLLDEADCGRAFDNGDSWGLARFIRHLAANPLKASHLGRSGRRYLEDHFTPEIVARKYLEVFDQAFLGDE
ncbi:MAG: glycosyltransferase family 4 protein [Cyanobacteriota bacterium]|nr:glycosyltransferase family 4 protein [Cyanobacteriota bacterium]